MRGITSRYEAVVVRVREGNRDVTNGFCPLNRGFDTGQIVIPENKIGQMGVDAQFEINGIIGRFRANYPLDFEVATVVIAVVDVVT